MIKGDRDEGFTIIEILLAAAILGVGLVPVLSSIISAMEMINIGASDTVATTTALSTIWDPDKDKNKGYGNGSQFTVRTDATYAGRRNDSALSVEVRYEAVNGQQRTVKLHRSVSN